MPTITGTIAVAPADCRVLLLDAALEHALATTVTDTQAFELVAPDDAAGVVLARLRGPVFGAAHAPAAAHVTLDPAVHAPLWPVEIVAEGELPPELRMTCSPVRIPGFPDGPDGRWTYQLGDRATEPFAQWTLTGGRAEVVMQACDWIVDASYTTPPRVRPPGGGASRAWSIASARDDRGEIAVEGGCARIRIERPTRLVLTIAAR